MKCHGSGRKTDTETRQPLQILGALLVAALLLFGGDHPAHAANFAVNRTADTIDAKPGDGVCADSDNHCTLRAAIMEANALPGADTVTLPAGTYTLSQVAGAAASELVITDDVTIEGAGAASTIIDADGIDRVLEVLPGATVQIHAVTVQNGVAGGIFNRGTLTLIGTTVSGNTALNFGGGIFNSGTMTLVDTTVTNNDTVGPNLSGGGGGIFNQGTMTLTGTTVSGTARTQKRRIGRLSRGSHRGVRLITQITSAPPKADLPTVTPTTENPWSPASRSSFCMVEVREVANNRYSQAMALLAASRSRITATSRPPNEDSKTVCPRYSKPSFPACWSSFYMVDVREVASSLYRLPLPALARSFVITTSTSLPPIAVSPPMTPANSKPASAASFISLSIVDVLVVAKTR